MLKYITTKDQKYNGLLYRGRKVIADEKYLERLVKVPEAIVYSSWRSLDEQKELLKQGKTKTLQSNHRRGMAVDVINWKDVQKQMNKVGLINDISWDRNHFAYDSEAKATVYPIYDSLPKNLKEYKNASVPVKTPEVVSNVVEEVKTPVIAKIEPKEEVSIYTPMQNEIKEVINEKSPEPTLIPALINLIQLIIKKLWNK